MVHERANIDSSSDIAGQSKKIENLLSSAVGLAAGLLNSEGNETNANASLLPAILSFSVSHTEKIVLQDQALAIDYLSLPASEYSVLSTKYVSRSQHSENDGTFFITIPIGKVGDNVKVSESISPRSIDMCAVSDVVVNPQPERGKVVMTSGPILFAPQSSLICNGTAVERRGDLKALRSILPPWLVADEQEDEEEEEEEEEK